MRRKSLEKVKERGEKVNKGVRLMVCLLIATVFVLPPASILGIGTANEDNGGRPGEWGIETVDSAGDVGEYCSLALDSSGYPHISYRDKDNDALKHAWWDGTIWHKETVDVIPGAYGVRYTSIDIDSNDKPHIAYKDYENDDLKYAKNTTGTWETETVDSAGDTGWYLALALDSSDNPHISFSDWPGYDYRLKYAKNTTGTWEIEVVDAAVDAGKFTSIALDSNGYPHISYNDGNLDDLKYAKWNGTAWETETVDSVGDVGTGTSLALDSNGYPHISYGANPFTTEDLKYAKWNGATWEIEIVDSPGFGWTSIALDSNDYSHIAYPDQDADDLKYAKWNGTDWKIEIVDNEGEPYFPSIALGSNDYPHIGYYDMYNMDLKYAKKASLDIIPPQISNVQANPYTQISGGCVNISVNVTDNIGVDEVYLNITYPDSSIENFSIKQNKTGDIYYCNKTYTSVGTYNFFIWANDTSGNENISDTYYFEIQPEEIQHTFTFHQGWNLITIPVENNFTAKSLIENITGCQIVCCWDSIDQEYKCFTIHSPDSYDFPIENGMGYFIGVTEDSNFSVTGRPISNVSIDLHIDWNLIGWFKENSTTAKSLLENITSCQIVCRWGSIAQEYDCFTTSSPPEYSFAIEIGTGLFVGVTQESQWHGEG